MALELYPLVTDKGDAIPFEVAKALGSYRLSTATTYLGLLPVGAVVAVFSDSSIRMAMTTEATVDMSVGYVADSFYLPAGAVGHFQVVGPNVFLATIEGHTADVYVTVLETWRSMAVERALTYA